MSNYKVNSISESSLNPNGKNGLPLYKGSSKKIKQVEEPSDRFEKSDPNYADFIEKQKEYLEAAKRAIVQKTGDSYEAEDHKIK